MQMRVQVVIDTDELLRWAVKHRELGHENVADVLVLAANHYAALDVDPEAAEDPPAPAYPAAADAADAVELRNWAGWHADRRPAGVAHVLYEAADTATRGQEGQG